MHNRSLCACTCALYFAFWELWGVSARFRSDHSSTSVDCEEECRELHIRPFFLLTTLSAACKRLGTRPSSWPPFLSQRGGASTCSTFRHGRPHRASCRHLCRGYFGLHVTHLWDHGPCLAVCRCPQPPTGFPHTISESSAGLSKEGPAREHERAARVSSTTTSASTLRR